MVGLLPDSAIGSSVARVPQSTVTLFSFGPRGQEYSVSEYHMPNLTNQFGSELPEEIAKGFDSEFYTTVIMINGNPTLLPMKLSVFLTLVLLAILILIGFGWLGIHATRAWCRSDDGEDRTTDNDGTS